MLNYLMNQRNLLLFQTVSNLPSFTKIISVNNLMQAIGQISYSSSTLYYHNLSQPYDRDIIPGVYEGGFKVWECTIDLLRAMQGGKVELKDKKVIDLGCGHGILGMAALKSGSGVCMFQDFNSEVLAQITTPNIDLNKIDKEKCLFHSGDWSSLNCDGQKYDLILGSELIYKEENYSKVIDVCERMLKPEGIAVLANKHYYFGVGGGMDGFKDAIEQRGMDWETMQKIIPPKGGNRKQIISLKLKK